MKTSLRRIEILGVYRVRPTPEEFEEARRLLFGNDDLADVQTEMHFAKLYLIEIKVSPANADIDWSEFTQADQHKPRSSWQVAYDERRIGRGHWTFFFHNLDTSKPLDTPVGPVPLPESTWRPSRLDDIEYQVP